MGNIRLYHVTLWEKEFQNELIPQIPNKMIMCEDDTTPRISMAPSVKQCLFGMANGRFWLDDDRIRVYMCDIDEDDIYLDDWKTIYYFNKVLDAPLSHEYWYKARITPSEYVEYRVNNPLMGYHLLLWPRERERLITYIEEEGIAIPNHMKGWTATEIIDYYRECDVIDAVKKRLSCVIEADECEDKDLFFDIFGAEYSPRTYEKKDYLECEYLDDFVLCEI